MLNAEPLLAQAPRRRAAPSVLLMAVLVAVNLLALPVSADDDDGDGVDDDFDTCPGTPGSYSVGPNGCPLDDDGDSVYNEDDNCPLYGAGYVVDGFGCPSDSDGDLVYDEDDDCPSAGAGYFVDAFGCPGDTDADAVYDEDDLCPATNPMYAVDLNGCPQDDDGDLVYNEDDDCPGTAPGAIVDVNGCTAPVDTDGDGVNDAADGCPATPFGATVDGLGCPIDTDGDLVYDGLDACPASNPLYAVDGNGCTLDADNDAVPDALDACGSTPPGASVDINGCSDVDGDGVLEGTDVCPDTPLGTTVLANGCSDADEDGVADTADFCADTTPGATVDGSGCDADAVDARALGPCDARGAPVYLFNSFECDPVVDSGLWHLTEERSASATHSLWYGQESTGDYDTGAANSGTMVLGAAGLGPVVFGTDIHLRFWSDLVIDGSTDRAYVEGFIPPGEGGGVWFNIATFTLSDTGYRDLPINGLSGLFVTFRVRFDTVDAVNNDETGWFVDDVCVYTGSDASVCDVADPEILFADDAEGSYEVCEELAFFGIADCLSAPDYTAYPTSFAFDRQSWRNEPFASNSNAFGYTVHQWSNGPGTYTLRSPAIDLRAFDGPVGLQFWSKSNIQFGSVMVRAVGQDGTSVESFFPASDPGTMQTLDISALDGKWIRLEFRATFPADAFDPTRAWSIDDLCVYSDNEPSGCPDDYPDLLFYDNLDAPAVACTGLFTACPDDQWVFPTGETGAWAITATHANTLPWSLEYDTSAGSAPGVEGHVYSPVIDLGEPFFPILQFWNDALFGTGDVLEVRLVDARTGGAIDTIFIAGSTVADPNGQIDWAPLVSGLGGEVRLEFHVVEGADDDGAAWFVDDVCVQDATLDACPRGPVLFFDDMERESDLCSIEFGVAVECVDLCGCDDDLWLERDQNGPGWHVPVGDDVSGSKVFYNGYEEFAGIDFAADLVNNPGGSGNDFQQLYTPNLDLSHLTGEVHARFRSLSDVTPDALLSYNVQPDYGVTAQFLGAMPTSGDETRDIDLTPYVGHQVRLEFGAFTFSSTDNLGWRIDDVCVYTGNDGSVCDGQTTLLRDVDLCLGPEVADNDVDEDCDGWLLKDGDFVIDYAGDFDPLGAPLGFGSGTRSVSLDFSGMTDDDGASNLRLRVRMEEPADLGDWSPDFGEASVAGKIALVFEVESPDADLNAGAGGGADADLVLCIPKAFFTTNGFTPANIRVLEYSDGALVTTNANTITYAADLSDADKECFRIHLEGFSAFALVGVAGGGGGGGGGGGSQPLANSPTPQPSSSPPDGAQPGDGAPNAPGPAPTVTDSHGRGLSLRQVMLLLVVGAAVVGILWRARPKR